MRIPMEHDDDAEVPMSPLIDCVFLLLIFFLVTTMIKFKEKQIPVTLPDPTSSLSQTADRDVYIIGIDVEGNYYRTTGEPTRDGQIVYAPMDDLAAFLGDLATTRSTDAPLRLSADRETPFQTVIDALDICQLQGFSNVEVKTRQRKE